MNKKRWLLVISLAVLALVLTGCVKTNEDGTAKLIYLTTSYDEIKNSGFLYSLLVYPLAQAVNYLSSKVGVLFGVALVTVILNLIVVVLTFKSNISMQRMQQVQPELQKIQAKYEGRTDQASQQRQAMEMQALYAKYDIKPFGAILSTFVQFPILIAMYSAIRSSAEVTNGTFLGISLATTPKEGFATFNVVLIIIYLLMIVLQFLSIRIPTLIAEIRGKKEAEKHHKRYEKPQQQNVVMTYGMLVMIGFIMLSWPTALSLYYCIVSLVNIVKTIVIDKMTHKE